MHFGVPTDFQMETYTRVLKGQITLAATIFPNKVKVRKSIKQQLNTCKVMKKYKIVGTST